MTRLAKNVLSIEYTVAEFAEGVYHTGMSEYPFTVTLPESVTHSLMLQFGENNLSQTFYLKAQMEPRQQNQYVPNAEKVSMLRCDVGLYLYKPHVEGEETK